MDSSDLVNIPYFTWSGTLGDPERYAHRAFDRRLATWCEAHQVPHLDTLPTLAGADIDTLRLGPRDIHFNDRGHALMGRLIGPWLARVASAARAE